MAQTENSGASGALFAVAAYGSWGLVPIYWKALGPVPAIEVLAHRVVWSLVFVSVVVLAARKGGEVRAALRSRRMVARLLLTTALVSANWGLFIWAVQSGRLLQASLGYYINPLLNVLLGVAVLGERLRRGQLVAVALAASGVAVLTLAGGVLPWVSLLLAGSFGLYGLLRKTAQVDAITGLFVETALMAPLSLAYIARCELSGGALGRATLAGGALLAACGLVTALPLLWFTAAARRLPLSTLGFFQYIAPTLQFLLATRVYGEPVTRVHLATFGLIWAGLAVFTVDARRAALQARGLRRNFLARGLSGCPRDGQRTPDGPRALMPSAPDTLEISLRWGDDTLWVQHRALVLPLVLGDPTEATDADVLLPREVTGLARHELLRRRAGGVEVVFSDQHTEALVEAPVELRWGLFCLRLARVDAPPRCRRAPPWGLALPLLYAAMMVALALIRLPQAEHPRRRSPDEQQALAAARLYFLMASAPPEPRAQPLAQAPPGEKGRGPGLDPTWMPEADQPVSIARSAEYRATMSPQEAALSGQMQGQRAAMRACYRDALAIHPGAQGFVVLRVVVDGAGSLSVERPAASPLHACLARIVERMTVTPDGARRVLDVPVRFLAFVEAP